MNSLVDGQWRILERVAQGAPQSESLEAIVRLIEAQSDGMLCSILLFDPRKQTLHHGAAPSLPAEYVRAIDGSKIGPTEGSCGAAAFRQAPVIAEDTSTHPNWAPWRALAKRHRLRACWSTPILSPDRALLGTFAMYYDAPREPTEVELFWISTATHLACVAITLARQAELEEQLRRAQRMEAVGKLAGGIAHDFNNLLSVIIGYSTMVADSLSETDPVLSDVEEVRRAAGRASELTRQLLAFARRQVMEPHLIDLNEVLRGLHSMLQRVLGEHIVLTLETNAEPASVRVDPGQLEQVVMNLVVNARDAMPRGGELSLRTDSTWVAESSAAHHPGTAPGRYVSISVSDTGEGMDAATMGCIFDPFFTTKEHGKGTGLGLSTVWGIVTQSGGSISVQSSPGAGARFEVLFPAAEGATAPAVMSTKVTSPAEGSETILVVEDEEQVRNLIGSLLRRAGYHVLEAEDGRDGLAQSDQHPGCIHLLLTDVIMPRMNGPELVRALVKARPQTKVVYLTGYTENAMVGHGVLDDSITVLAKPIAPQELLREVRSVLDRG
ncbi:MAG: sensory box histidine kinase/response regulator [Polyangiaceae bacterium]|jgi:signal transduction histidine kinase/CheY-like chemotaxis protein|nr:sensory box histidine kinase/response regulator [Polyangiaceae bacterium]